MTPALLLSGASRWRRRELLEQPGYGFVEPLLVLLRVVTDVVAGNAPPHQLLGCGVIDIQDQLASPNRLGADGSDTVPARATAPGVQPSFRTDGRLIHDNRAWGTLALRPAFCPELLVDGV